MTYLEESDYLTKIGVYVEVNNICHSVDIWIVVITVYLSQQLLQMLTLATRGVSNNLF